HEAGVARHRCSSARRARLCDGPRILRARCAGAISQCVAGGLAHGVGRACRARARQSPSSRHARTTFGALGNEPAPEAAAAGPLPRIHHAFLPACRSAASRRRVSRAARAVARAVDRRRASGAVCAHSRSAKKRASVLACCRSMNPSPESLSDLNEAKQILEAALLVAGEPVSIAQLGRLFEPALDADTVEQLLDEIKADWNGRKVELAQVASGWRFQGRREVQPYLDRLSPEKPPR